MRDFEAFGTSYERRIDGLDIAYLNALCDPLMPQDQEELVLEVFGNKRGHVDPNEDAKGAALEMARAKKAWYALRQAEHFELWLKKAVLAEVARLKPQVMLKTLKMALGTRGPEAAKLAATACRAVHSSPDAGKVFDFELAPGFRAPLAAEEERADGEED